VKTTNAHSLGERASALASNARSRSPATRGRGRGRLASIVVNSRATSGKGEYYVGKGKYIKDDGRRLLELTGRDEVVGGFAGGEVGLQAYRAELNSQDATRALKKEKKPRKESKEVNLKKDFGVLAGGFPGGEKGLQIYNATGTIPDTTPATLGWGPPALALITVLAGYTYLTTGELTTEALVSTAQSLTTKASEIDTQALSSGATGALGTAAGVVGQAVDLLPDEVKDAGSQAAQVALAVLLGGFALKIVIGKVTKVIGSSFKIIALGATSTAIALKILNIL